MADVAGTGQDGSTGADDPAFGSDDADGFAFVASPPDDDDAEEA